jgi:hypothetical protein
MNQPEVGCRKFVTFIELLRLECSRIGAPPISHSKQFSMLGFSVLTILVIITTSTGSFLSADEDI